MSRAHLIMPCPKCASTGTELAEGVRTGWFTPPTAMFRCRSCALILYGDAALRAAGKEIQEKPKMEDPISEERPRRYKKGEPCRWQPCTRLSVSHGWCHTHRERIIGRGASVKMTDAEAAEFIAGWKPKPTRPPSRKGVKKAAPPPSLTEAEVPTVYLGPSALEAIKRELSDPEPEPVEATPPPSLTEAELLRRMEMYEELRRLRIAAKDWAGEVSHAREKLEQVLQLFAEANAKVTELEAKVFAPVTA